MARASPLYRKPVEPEPLPKSASDSSSFAPSRKFDRDMQVPPETQVAAGDQVRLSVQPGRLHFFDPESEAAIMA